MNKEKLLLVLKPHHGYANVTERHHHYMSVLGARREEARQIHSNRHSCAVLSQVLVVAMKRTIVMWTE